MRQTPLRTHRGARLDYTGRVPRPMPRPHHQQSSATSTGRAGQAEVKAGQRGGHTCGKQHSSIEPTTSGDAEGDRSNTSLHQANSTGPSASSSTGNVLPRGDNSKPLTQRGTPAAQSSYPARAQKPQADTAKPSAAEDEGQSSSSGQSGGGAKPADPLSDGRALRKGQPNRIPPQATSSNPTASTQQRGTPLASILRDGRRIPKPRDEQGPSPGPADRAAPTSTTTTTWTTATTTTDSQPGTHVAPPSNAGESSDDAVVMQSNHPQPVRQRATQSIFDNTGTTLTQPAASTATTAAQPTDSSSPGTGRLRSWQQVEQSLMEICRLSQDVEGPSGRRIQAQAEQALLNLLVDTQTAEELSEGDLDCGGQQQTQDTAVTATAAVQGIRHLRDLALASSTSPNVALSYAHVAPHVAVIVTWLNTMAVGDVRIHAQLLPLIRWKESWHCAPSTLAGEATTDLSRGMSSASQANSSVRL